MHTQLLINNNLQMPQNLQSVQCAFYFSMRVCLLRLSKRRALFKYMWHDTMNRKYKESRSFSSCFHSLLSSLLTSSMFLVYFAAQHKCTQCETTRPRSDWCTVHWFYTKQLNQAADLHSFFFCAQENHTRIAN